MPGDAAGALHRLYQAERRVRDADDEVVRTRRILEGDATASEPRPRLLIARDHRDRLAATLATAETQEREERARARSHETQLFSGRIHNPRELSQLATELEQLRGRLATEEVAELELLTALDAAEEEVRQALAEASEAHQRLQTQLAAAEEARRQLEAQRAAIPAAHLHLYERVATYRPPPPVVEMRNGICTGCRLPLSTSQVRALRAAIDPLTCETCGRIMLPA